MLSEIIEHKKIEVSKRRELLSLEQLKEKVAGLQPLAKKSFKEAIKKKDKINVIAEIKKSSPSKGIINQDIDILDVANIYENGGVAAISVLTDEKFFNGSLENLKKVSEQVSIPCLYKDFIVSEYQIYEAMLYGASAFLLIVKAITREELERFVNIGLELGLDALVEVHDKQDIDKIKNMGISIIGVNNRSLEDLSVDINRSLEMKKYLHENGKIFVSESGIETHEHIKKMQNAGFDAVLVGTSLMQSKNIELTLKELIGHG